MRSLPNIRTVVGRFLNTRADIFLLGGWLEYWEYSVSFVTEYSTPAIGVNISELPRQTFVDFPSWNLFFLRPSFSAKASYSKVFMHPVLQTARTVDPLRCQCCGDSNF